MRICIYGAGAVGGYVAARLIASGRHDVAIVARGEHLAAMRMNGLTLITPEGGLRTLPHAVTDAPGDLPGQDLVFVTLKAHAQSAAAGDIASLLGAHGTAVFASNGIPWWWNHRGAADAQPLSLLDPGGALWRRVGPHRALGCVVYSANEVVRPGVVRHVANNRWVLGEPDGSRSKRLLEVVELMNDAGMRAEVAVDIRNSIWGKLLRNAPLNSVCALTRLPVDRLSREPRLQLLCNAVIDEIAAIALADGHDLQDRLEDARSAITQGAAIDGRPASDLRPSMLQDVLGGRRMEVQAILGQVQALARANNTPCPTLDVLLALTLGLNLAVEPTSRY